MRVIAGKARGTQLKCMDGTNTRPTTDRIKETLFNMLSGDIWGSRFLDLFSGSGAIGIEALSRGASEAVFVENNRTALKYISENLKRTGLTEHAQIVPMDCASAVGYLEDRSEFFDIVFMDPPYNRHLEKEILRLMQRCTFVTPATMIIIEASSETDFSWLEEYGYILIKTKKYKTNQHVFVKKLQELRE